ncbi:MAG: hypothetical protein SP4CHLAM5_06470 [Chlamydiia bacterium]|nr:hypothetical protein [Chlamydiia bacterium]MCH9618515.1 hypothetical protein [Chlamydiia bacterium]MCH9623804.1 hypothetical protein [Chlamydiia bacterium]
MLNNNIANQNLLMMPVMACNRVANRMGYRFVSRALEVNPIISAIVVNVLAGMSLNLLVGPIGAAVIGHAFFYSSLVQCAINNDPTRTVQRAFGY